MQECSGFSGKTCYVTGGTGFVGAAVIRNLIGQKALVRALVRPCSDRTNLDDLPVELVEGGLDDRRFLADSMDGVDAVFHVAADYRLWVPDPDSMYKANVKGTENIMNASIDAHVDRVVYTSSVATIGLPKNGDPSCETTKAQLSDMVGHYKRSKFLAEEVVRTMVKAGKLKAVIVNPSTPVGPGDIKPTPTGRIILDALTGRMPAYVDTGLNLVHVDDVARGHLLAHDKGKVGQRYILGGQDMTLKNILDEISNITGQKPHRIRLPHKVVLPIAYVSEAVAKVMGTVPRATVDGVRMSMKFMYFSADKAKSELGFAPRPAIEAIRSAVDWFKANNYC